MNAPVWPNIRGLFHDLRELTVLAYRKSWALPLFLVVFGALGFLAGHLSPWLYQADAVVGPRLEPSPVSSYRLAAQGTLRGRENRLRHTIGLGRSTDVLEHALRTLGPDAPRVFATLGPLPNDTDYVHMARVARQHLIELRRLRDPEAVRISVRAADSALARRLCAAVVAGIDAVLRERLRAEADLQIEVLTARLRVEADPVVRAAIEDALAAEEARKILVGEGALDVYERPVSPTGRAAPNRTQLMLLSVYIGGVCWLIWLFAGSPWPRRRWLALPGPPEPYAPSAAGGVRGLVRDIALAMLLFGIIYGIVFIRAPSFSTTRAGIALLFLVTLLRGIDPLAGIVRRHLAILVAVALVLVHAILGFMTGTRDTIIASRVLEGGYMLLLGPFLFIGLAGADWTRFHRLMVIAVTSQSVVHIYSFFSPDYRAWVAGILRRQGNYELTYAIVPPGFSNGAGASFSIVQALGVLSAMILLARARTASGALLLTLCALVSLVSAGVAGRTGLIASLLFMGLFALRSGLGIRIAVSSVVAVLVVLLTVFFDDIKFLFSLMGEDLDWQFNSMMKRSLEIFRNPGSINSLNELAAMYIPPLQPETVFGTGVGRIVFGARHDSAYVQFYYALGLPMTVLFYFAFFWFVLRLWTGVRESGSRPGREDAWVLPWLVGLMFVLDVKEFFLTHAIGFYVVTCLLLLTHRDPAPAEAGSAPGRSP